MKKLLLLFISGLALAATAQVSFPKDTVEMIIHESDQILNEEHIVITNNKLGATLDYNYAIFADDFKGTAGWTVQFCDCKTCKEDYDPTGSCTNLASGEHWTFAVDVITKKAYDNKFFSISFINPNDPTDADTLTIRTKIGNRLSTKSYNSLNVNLTVAPNPSSDRVNISFDASSGKNYSLSVVNLLGEVVEQFDIHGNNQASSTDLDVSSMEAGIYFVRLNNGIDSEIHKLVVN